MSINKAKLMQRFEIVKYQINITKGRYIVSEEKHP
jgi:hypothetical protein